ncbi:hypothetical protein EV363DRAFT_1165481 [Boletus edulis]|nr:hypothetical protein EV363DRAFT_1165481 [Boletus edulis]
MHLLVNPHDAIPPDYLAERYTASCQTFIDDFNIDNEQAALRLTNLWLVQNAIDREEWDAHEQAEELIAQQRKEQQCIEADEQHRQQEEEEEQIRQEEHKKNRNKFLPFADVPMSNTPPVIPLPLALHKLRKGEFCELYFFTNKGLADAQVTVHSTDDEALTLMQDEHSLHSFVPLVLAKAKQNVIKDKDLTWQQIDEATHHILTAMNECGWDDQRIQVHLQFWLALGTHSWRHHQDERCQHASSTIRQLHERGGTTPLAPQIPLISNTYNSRSLMTSVQKSSTILLP